MATFDGYEIKLESADEKGMLNANAIMKFLSKATKAVCEINIPKGGFGSGFFCKIPYTENNNVLLPVLITNNHVLSSDLLDLESIEIILEGESKTIPLTQRKKWTNKDMDFTFIEIKEEEDNIHSFYNLDEDVLDEDFSNEGYINQNVIIFAINKNDKQVGFSNGIIKKNIDCFFAYNCNTLPGCSGGCIVNQFNNGVIGIHRGEIKTGNKKVVNQGIYIKDVIKYIKNSNQISLPIVNN